MRRYGLGRVYRPKGSRVWWVRYSHRGKRYDESSGSHKEQVARNLLKARLGEAMTGRFIGPAAERVTLADLEQMVKDDHALKQRKSVAPFGRVREYFGAGTRALDISSEKVTAYALARMEAGAAPQTVRNEIGALGRGFTLAYRAGRLPHRPHFELPRVNNVRTGFVGDAEMRALLPHLIDYMRPFIEAAYITGWRRGELRNLRWKQVDWQGGTLRLERGATKSGEPRSFPFAAHPRLAELLCERREATSRFEREAGSVCPWVFHRRGHQVGCYYDGWRSACKKAGLEGLLVHDLRRSAARNLVRAGVSERVAMTLTGHLTRSVFDRYNIVSGADQSEAVRKLAAHCAQVKPEPGRVATLSSREGAA